jgi:hypothetical protein
MEELKIKFHISEKLVGEKFDSTGIDIKMIRGMWNVLGHEYV